MRRNALLLLALNLIGSLLWAEFSFGADQSRCQISTEQEALKPFALKVQTACEKLELLCAAVPNHYNCAAINGVTEFATDLTVSELTKNTDFTNASALVVDDWLSGFSVDYETGLVNIEELPLYEKKGELLNALSRNTSPLFQTTLTQIVLSGTLQYTYFFGDPYDMYADGTDKIEFGTFNIQSVDLAQQASVTLGWVTGLAFSHLAHSRFVKPLTLIKNMPYLSAYIRNHLPITTSVGVAAGMSEWTSLLGKYEATHGIKLPASPAHMVHFNSEMPHDLVAADMDAAWEQKLFEIMALNQGESAALGTWLVVGEIGARYGSRASNGTVRLMLNNSAATAAELASGTARIGKLANLFRVVRITPAGLIIGETIAFGVREVSRQIRLNKINDKLTLGGEQNISSALNELYQFFAGESHFASKMINFYLAFESFGALDAGIKNSARVNQTRFNFVNFLAPENRPELTGAAHLRDTICKAVSEVLPPFKSVGTLTAEQKKAIDDREIPLSRGGSWRFIDHFQTELKKYSDRLSDYSNYLQQLRRSRPMLKPQFEERLAAIGRWQSDVKAFETKLQLESIWQSLRPARFFEKSYAHEQTMNSLRRIISIEWRQNNPQFKTLYRCP